MSYKYSLKIVSLFIGFLVLPPINLGVVLFLRLIYNFLGFKNILSQPFRIVADGLMEISIVLVAFWLLKVRCRRPLILYYLVLPIFMLPIWFDLFQLFDNLNNHYIENLAYCYNIFIYKPKLFIIIGVKITMISFALYLLNRISTQLDTNMKIIYTILFLTIPYVLSKSIGFI